MATEINVQDADITHTTIFDLLDGDWEADSAEALEVDRYFEWLEERYEGYLLLREQGVEFGYDMAFDF